MGPGLGAISRNNRDFCEKVEMGRKKPHPQLRFELRTIVYRYYKRRLNLCILAEDFFTI